MSGTESGRVSNLLCGSLGFGLLLAKHQLGEVPEVALPDFEVVAASGDDVVVMGDLFLVEHGVHALGDSEQAVLVTARDVQEPQFFGGLGWILDQVGGLSGVGG